MVKECELDLSMAIEDQLRNCDCLSDLGLKTIQDHTVQLIIADLPYNMTMNEWDKSLIPIDPLWVHFLRILKDDGTIVFFATQPFTTYLINSNPNLFRYDIVWLKEKGTHQYDCKKQPLRSHESLLIFTKGNAYYSPQMTKGSPYTKIRKAEKGNTTNYGKDSISEIRSESEGSRYPISVLYVPRDHANVGIHPTQKPIELMDWIIKSFSQKFDLIVDPTFGSASSYLSALQLNRKYIGFELNKEIYHLALQRAKMFEYRGKDDFKKPSKPSKSQRNFNALIKS